MKDQVFLPSRRAVLTGLGGTALARGLGGPALAQNRPNLSIRARPLTLALEAGQPESPIWALDTGGAGALRFAKGEISVALWNELPAPITLNWLGIDGVQSAAALTGEAPLPAAAQSTFVLPLRQAGTFLVSARFLGDSAAPALSARALVVAESDPITVDRDEVLLIEEWRLKADRSTVAAGQNVEGTTARFTINALPAVDIAARQNERLRLRFLNGCARSPVGIRIENHDLRVMAIDGAPAEPFMARDGQIILAPGSRIDAFVDATRAPGTVSQIVLHDGAAPRPIGRITMLDGAPVRAAPLPPAPPLPASGLPVRLGLQGALRADLSLDPKSQWTAPAAFNLSNAPALRAKRGRTVVVTINNPTAAPVVFRLHGHHFRLLDRLDDGWKPFWLDTLMLDKGQTQRIAFAAEYPGRWLMEATALNWTSPALLRWYAVE